MSLAANKTTGKAVADIKSVYFRQFKNGVEPTVSAEELASEDWFPVATIRGSVNISQDAVSIEKINIDQSNMPIGITTEPGDFNFEAVLASLASADLQKWFGTGTALKDIVGSDGTTKYSGMGYENSGDVIECSAFIETRTGDAFIFPHVMLSAALNKDDKVFGLTISGQVLATTNSANKSVYILADHSVAAGGSVL